MRAAKNNIPWRAVCPWVMERCCVVYNYSSMLAQLTMHLHHACEQHFYSDRILFPSIIAKMGTKVFEIEGLHCHIIVCYSVIVCNANLKSVASPTMQHT